MKKKLLVGLLAVCATVALASCSEVHTHSFAEDWSSDDNIHWHACECATNVMDSVGAHVDANKDEKCDVCSHAVPNNDHEHSFASAWSSNDSIHWHACECATNVMDSVAVHVDANKDGVCDVCSYDADHEHTYSEDYASDASGHWHNASCGHDVKTAVEAHAANSYGVCSKCGYTVSKFAATSVSDAVDAVVANTSNVYNGKVTAYSSYYDEYADEQTYSQAGMVEYSKEDGYFYVSSNGSEVFYYPNGDSVLGVSVSPSGVSSVPAVEENLSGYQADLSQFVNGLEEEYAYGAENLVAALYDLAQNSSITEMDESVNDVDGDKVYSFSFVTFSALFSDNYYAYASDVTVEFTVDPASIAIGSLNITAEFIAEKVYSWETYDYVYNITSEEDGEGNVTYTIDPNAHYENALKIELVQNYVKEEVSYAPSNVLYSSFAVKDVDSEELLGDTLSLNIGDLKTYTLVDVLPLTAISALNEVKVYYNGELASFWQTDIISTYNESLGTFTLKGTVPGEYDVEIVAGNYTKTVTVTVVRPLPTEINASVLDDNGYTFSQKTEVSVELGTDVYVKAEVDNENADDSFDIAFKEVYENATMEEATLYAGCYKISATAVGDYVVVLTSKADSTLSVELTITVIEVADDEPAPSTGLEGIYEAAVTNQMGVTNYFYMTIGANNSVSFDFSGYVCSGTYIQVGNILGFTIEGNVYGVADGTVNSDGSISVSTTAMGFVDFVLPSSGGSDDSGDNDDSGDDNGSSDVVASDFETAVTQTWVIEMNLDDLYYLTFDTEEGTALVENYYNGGLFGSSLYSFVYSEEDGIVFTLVENVMGTTDLLDWYFGGTSGSWNDTFTVLTVGNYPLEVSE